MLETRRDLDLAAKAGVYVPYTQTAISFFQPSELAIRTTRLPLTIAQEVQAAVWSVDRDQPVSNLRTMDDIVEVESPETGTPLPGTYQNAPPLT